MVGIGCDGLFVLDCVVYGCWVLVGFGFCFCIWVCWVLGFVLVVVFVVGWLSLDVLMGWAWGVIEVGLLGLLCG